MTVFNLFDINQSTLNSTTEDLAAQCIEMTIKKNTRCEPEKLSALKSHCNLIGFKYKAKCSSPFNNDRIKVYLIFSGILPKLAFYN